MRPRTLKLGSGTWRYLINRHETTLWSPSGKRCVVKNGDITGEVHSCYDSDFGEPPCPGPLRPVTPGALRLYIERLP